MCRVPGAQGRPGVTRTALAIGPPTPRFVTCVELIAPGGNRRKKDLVVSSVAAVGSATRRYGSALAARSGLFDSSAIARSDHMTAVSGMPTRALYDSTDSLLRFAMRADATLTGLCGLAVAFVADPLSSLTGLTSIQEYSLGAFFVLYGLVVFSLAALPDLRRAGIGVVVANIVYTLGAVVAAGAVPMTAIGVAATLATGVYTAGFA